MTLIETFEYWWKNPPPPFNPDYKPYAKKCWDQAAKAIASKEPFPDKQARKEAFRKEYKRLIKKHEAKKFY